MTTNPADKTVNVTTMFIVIGALSAVALAGGVVLTITGNDAAGFYGFVGVTMTSVIGYATISRQQANLSNTVQAVNDGVQTVDAKVNGNLTKLINLAVDNATTRAERRAVEEVADRVGLTSTGSIPVVQ